MINRDEIYIDKKYFQAKVNYFLLFLDVIIFFDIFNKNILYI